MNILYRIGIGFYEAGIFIAALFSRKARLLVKGHSHIMETLKEKVEPGRKYLWFHAASLGEFEQGRPLIESIRASHPEYGILQTFFSPSGFEVRKDYKGADIVCYMPFDRLVAIRRFLNAVPVEMAFFVKYEFWPCTLGELKRRSIKTYSISSIFRPTQLFFKRCGCFYRKSLRCFDHLFVQDDASKNLLAGIGIENVTVVGDTRSDRVLQIAQAAKDLPIVQAFAGDSRVFIAGSSWPADEAVYVPYFIKRPEWKLIIASHEIHEERLQQIEHEFEGRCVLRYSQATPESAAKADVLIIDCFGLLSSIYRYGHIAYIGGGFGVGIHNTLEAAVYGIPVIFGPNNKRFREAQELKRLAGGFEVTDAYSFQMLMDKFISDPTFLQDSGKAAGSYVQSGSGTSQRILTLVGL